MDQNTQGLEFKLKDSGLFPRSAGEPKRDGGESRGMEDRKGSYAAGCRIDRRRKTDSWQAVTKAQIREVEVKAGAEVRSNRWMSRQQLLDLSLGPERGPGRLPCLSEPCSFRARVNGSHLLQISSAASWLKCCFWRTLLRAWTAHSSSRCRS